MRKTVACGPRTRRTEKRRLRRFDLRSGAENVDPRPALLNGLWVHHASTCGRRGADRAVNLQHEGPSLGRGRVVALCLPRRRAVMCGVAQREFRRDMATDAELRLRFFRHLWKHLRVIWPIASGLVGFQLALGAVIGFLERWSVSGSNDCPRMALRAWQLTSADLELSNRAFSRGTERAGAS